MKRFPPRAADLAHVDTWVFDLDNTLYHPNRCDLFPQMDTRMHDFLCRYLAIDEVAANEVRQRFFERYGTTLRGLMVEHGLTPHEFLDFVHDLDLAQLDADPILDDALARLPGRRVIFTNATVAHAQAVLARIGIAHHFEGIFDVEAAGFVPKPHEDAFAAFLKAHDIEPTRSMMFEDSAPNLETAHALGMKTCWIETSRPRAQPAEDAPHVHYIAEELSPWLKEMVDGLASS